MNDIWVRYMFKNINKNIIYNCIIIVKGNLKGVTSIWKKLIDESMGEIRNEQYDFLPWTKNELLQKDLKGQLALCKCDESKGKIRNK